jgi:mRNA-degrading endonuclease YafQ of YafQ-DinJ toxin-antitoxin module
MAHAFRDTAHFRRKHKKLIKGNPRLAKRIIKVLKVMRVDPFYQGLRTHKVLARGFGICYSSSVSGDIRIIWDFDKEERIVILLLTIGGHEGKDKVYN